MTTELKRRYFIPEEVESKSLLPIIEGIRNIAEHDDQEEARLKEYKREPIHLVIDSYGGFCYDALTLANLIRSIKTPVYTYCYGKAMSAGLLLFSTGTKRFIHRDATLMYHQLAGGAFGKYKSLVVAIEQKEKLHNTLTRIIASKVTGKGLKLIKKSNKQQTDLYISGKKALKYNFATDEILDGVISKPKKIETGGIAI